MLEHPFGADGGCFVPEQDGLMDAVNSLLELPGNGCTAAILNMLFDTELTGWDVDYCIGRSSMRVTPVGQRIAAGECWHNPEGSLSADADRLAGLIGGAHATGWVRTGVLAAVFAGLAARIHQEERGALPIHFAMHDGDLSAAMAAVHLRRWGFPIDRILISCSGTSGLWELLYRGTLHTDSAAALSQSPDEELIFPKELESLLYYAGGRETVRNYLACCASGAVFRPSAEVLETLRSMFTAEVIGPERMKRAAEGLYRTSGYVMSMQTAAAYAAVLDYRAQHGSYSPALILSERQPDALG